MTRTTGRTLALLALLQSRREWSGDELRERLEVSPRTLRRDIEDLRELGFGIEATRGRHGGYRLGAGASVPPLALAHDEAVAIAIGLRAAATGAVTGMEESAARALAKLERSLASATRERIETVERAMVPLPTQRGDVDLDTVTLLASAIAERRSVLIHYTRHDGETVRRKVEPHRIVHTTDRWYLVAFDADRAGWRTLRIDRMREARVQRDGFARREIPDDALRKFTMRSIATDPYRFRARVHVYAAAADVRSHFGPTVAEVEEADDGTSVLTAGANAPEEFAAYLGSSGFEFELLEGEEVRSAMITMAERLKRGSGERL